MSVTDKEREYSKFLKVGLSQFGWCQNFVLIIFFLPATKNLRRCNIHYIENLNVAPTQISCCREDENYEYEVLALTESSKGYLSIEGILAPNKGKEPQI